MSTNLLLVNSFEIHFKTDNNNHCKFFSYLVFWKCDCLFFSSWTNPFIYHLFISQIGLQLSYCYNNDSKETLLFCAIISHHPLSEHFIVKAFIGRIFTLTCKIHRSIPWCHWDWKIISLYQFFSWRASFSCMPRPNLIISPCFRCTCRRIQAHPPCR